MEVAITALLVKEPPLPTVTVLAESPTAAVATLTGQFRVPLTVILVAPVLPNITELLKVNVPPELITTEAGATAASVVILWRLRIVIVFALLVGEAVALIQDALSCELSQEDVLDQLPVFTDLKKSEAAVPFVVVALA